MRAVGFGLLVLATCATAAFGEDEPPDVIVLRGEGNRGGRIAIRCFIADYTGKTIQFRTSLSGDLKSRPANQVIDVKTRQSKPHVQGLLEFTRNRFDEARIQFEKALPLEHREWVRRELLAMLIRCALKRGDYQSACTRYVLLVKSDADTRHAHLLPLVWGPRELKNELKAKARGWVDDSNTAVQLLGASILVSDARFRNLGEGTLVRLMRASPEWVRDLARMQRWRKRLRQGDFQASTLVDWQAQIDRLDDSMRGGPYFLIGRGHLLRRESEQAAAAFLWLPLVYDHDHHLAARACLNAADALLVVGRETEAATLYREVLTRFRQTTFAQEADAQLRKLKAKVSKKDATSRPEKR